MPLPALLTLASNMLLNSNTIDQYDVIVKEVDEFVFKNNATQ